MATSGEGSNNSWSWQQVKAFERGLTYFPDGCEARWEKIAALIPGDKSLQQVKDHYKLLLNDVAAIEAGVPVLPKEQRATGSSSNHVAPVEAGGSNTDNQKGKKRKGEAWTKDEHRQFLLGMDSVGKGEWKIIAREFVKTRNPTQVASHAQKHFKRQNQNKQNVRRWSIFDLASLDDREQHTGIKCASCGFMNQIETPLTINESPLVIKETPPLVIKETPPLVIKETPLVVKETPSVIQEAPLAIKQTPLVMPEAPLVIPEAHLMMQEASLMMQETALVMQEAPAVNQEAPLAIKKTTLVIQEARDGGIMVGPRVDSPSLSPTERLCLESDADFFSQLSPL